MLFWKFIRICFLHIYQFYVLGMILQPFFSVFVHIICLREKTVHYWGKPVWSYVISHLQMHWICELYKLSTCWAFVEVLSSGVFKWPQKWLDMLSIPKISQKLMLNMAENLSYIHPHRTRKWLTALLVSELIDEDKKAKKKRRGKTRAWIRRRSSKGCKNIIVKWSRTLQATRKWCE